MENIVKAGIFGVCVGDALGVPVELVIKTQTINKQQKKTQANFLA